MKEKSIYFLLIFFIAGTSNSFSQRHLRLWYNKPANGWLESVPLGNGKLGAMPDGGIFNENVVLNDITLWSGGPQDADKPDAYKALPEIRKLIFEGKNAEAEGLVTKEFLRTGVRTGRAKFADKPYGCYQILGNLHVKYDYNITDTSMIRPRNYYRGLSLDSAMASCSYVLNGVTYHREYFTSFSNDVIIIRLSADKPGKINFTLSLNRPERYKTAVHGEELDMFGQLNNGTDGKGMRYLTRVSIKQEGGGLIAHDSTLQIRNSNEAIIYIAAGTDFRNAPYVQKTASVLNTALKQSYKKDVATHVAVYQKLFDRAKLSLDNQNLTQAALPTDERLGAFANDPSDNGLPELYFQFGRYLLICSTRPGLLPPNLQGLWANSIQPRWNSDYHLDINIEMNHWPLEVTNLPMLNEPFYALIKSLVKPGERTAKAYFDSPGWVAFVVTNVWGYTSPGQGASWGSNVAGSGWLCQVLWNHYAFTQDKDYLRRIYPVLKGAAVFYLHSMVKDPQTGWLVTVPSESPENAFYLPDGKKASISAGPTMDNQIIRELFTHVIDASRVLHNDIQFSEKLAVAKKQLPPNQIDSAGRLMEWLKPYKETDPHHRHMSPLWGLYPGNDITLTGTPKIAEAAKQLMIRRGDVSTGWSLAWKINLWARMQDGNHCFRLIKDLLRPTQHSGVNMKGGGGTYPNMFDAHPPFQIDGNFGGTAGIAEMLIQSNAGYIDLLPALPDQWANGSFKGLCVRGGAEVDASWENGRVTSVIIKATTNHDFKLKIPAYVKKTRITITHKIILPKKQQGMVDLSLKKGEKATIFFE